jgi:hypothetical protein
MDRYCLSLGWTGQPFQFAKLLAQPGVIDRGLLARFILIKPKEMAGTRQHIDVEGRPTVRRLNPNHREAWADYIRSNATYEEPNRHVLTMSPDVQMGFDQYVQGVEDLIPDAPDHMKPWLNREPGHALRLVAVFHTMTHPRNWPDKPISEENVSNVIELMDDLRTHYLAVMSVPEAKAKDALRILKWGTSRGYKEFTPRDVKQAMRGQRRNDAWIEPALLTLSQRGYIAEVKEEAKRVGRPSSRYRWHPDLYEN